MPQQGYHLGRDEGTALWFLDTLMHVKAGATGTRGAFTLIEVVAPEGFGTPLHLHEREEEGFYVLEGLMTVQCGDDSWKAGPGSFVLLPRAVPHTYLITSGPCRMLQVTSPSQFEDFAAEVGRPAEAATLPEPSAPDMPALLAAAARHGHEILGPPLTA
jgi:mannose-6-phosphate isomerase-like protein (cupin superfamily)